MLQLGPIRIGNFINAIIAFLIKALVVYYLIVKPFTALIEALFKTPEEKIATPVPPDIKLLQEIRDILEKNVQTPPDV